MFGKNLIQMRKLHQLTQEALAEKVGVTRQAIAKWEAGDSVPDLQTGRKLAEVLNVSLDELVSFETDNSAGLMMPPKGKHLFGIVTVGEKGQIIIPVKARKLFNIAPGDQMVVLGDETQQGLAMIKAENFLSLADMIRMQMKKEQGDL
ncbi:MAG: helix-turn-helix domain-containing protein [Clostridia bacterium]|nr:helix-turn-helix domain-containing protein [Clostridia bacterium]